MRLRRRLPPEPRRVQPHRQELRARAAVEEAAEAVEAHRREHRRLPPRAAGVVADRRRFRACWARCVW